VLGEDSVDLIDLLLIKSLHLLQIEVMKPTRHSLDIVRVELSID
jgi:hypothetical protein